ncbi:MAG: hypothetical protein K9G41_09685 [Flavobacteriales bacterium]|nr:hypothetical protein [Flavobacteriales bacterium]
MAAQDELFQLIKSLTPSEKRYFKTNASKGGDAKSNYVQLFDAIDSQTDEYDEELLKQKHAKKPFIKYLSAEKKYLREQVMKQMRAFNSTRTVDNRINELLQDEMFYRDKGLNDLREKALAKAKELAAEAERFHLLKEILKRQTAFVIEFEKKQLTAPVIQLINEQKHLSILQESELELQTKNRELFSILRSGADMQDPAVRNRVEMLYAEVERYRTRISQSFVLQSHYERACSNYHHLQRDFKSSFQHTKNEYELYQGSEHLKSEDAINYKICLANLMARSQSAHENDWFKKALEEMKALPANSFNEEGEVFQNIYFQEHLFYINNGEFEKAESLVPIIEEGLIMYEGKINIARKLAFQFNIMVMYFLMHNFKEALKWTEPLMDDNSEIKQEQKFVTTLLLPIIHFELGHADLVESFTRSAYRHLQKKKRLHEFERLVVKYLTDMPLSSNQVEFRLKLEEFNTQLERLIHDPIVKVTLGMEEMSLWAKSHLTGTKMSLLLKEAATTGHSVQ